MKKNDNVNANVESKKVYFDISKWAALFSLGLFRNWFWGLITIFRETKYGDGISPQTFASYSIISFVVLIISYFLSRYFLIDPPSTFMHVFLFLLIALFTLYLGMKYKLDKSFFFVLIVNVFQGYGLYHLFNKNEISLSLLFTILIQAALVLPSMETYQRTQLVELMTKSGQKRMLNWFTKISKKCPRNISQFYRTYIYIISCVLLAVTVDIHSELNINEEYTLSFSNLFKTPSITAFCIFIISLILISLKTESTDYISGWGRDVYSNMKDNFNLIISLYTLILILILVFYRFTKLKEIYVQQTDFTGNIVGEIIFIVIILFYIATMAFRLKSNPKYQIQDTEHGIVNQNKGVMSISYHVENKTKKEFNCKIEKMTNVTLEEGKERKVECIPGITTISFLYDKSSVNYTSLGHGFIDLSVSERKYKHRLYFSALHLKNSKTETKKSLTETNAENDFIYYEKKNVILDRYIIIEKYEFDPHKSMIHTSTLGLFNTTNNPSIIRVSNSKELYDKSIEVKFIIKNKRADAIKVPANTHLTNIIEIKFKYKKSLNTTRDHHLTALIIFEIDGFERIKLGYILEIQPKIYNDTRHEVIIEYPDSTKDPIQPNKIMPVRGTNIPVRAIFQNNKYIYFILKPGLTLLSIFESSNEKSTIGFYNELSIVGLKGSGKTTYLTMLALEAVKQHERITLVPNLRDTELTKILNKYKDRIDQNMFPDETPEDQFDCFNFQVQVKNKQYTLGIKDIAGEYFGSDYLNPDEAFCGTACKHFADSDFILITIDTDLKNIKEKDNQNLIMLRNISEEKNFNKERVRILFTKTDKGGITAENYENWLRDKMPQISTFLLKILCISSDYFYFVSIGEVNENERKIIKYSPQQVIEPIIDIIRDSW